MAKSFPKNPEKNDKGTNMAQISRNLRNRDNPLQDSRFVTRAKPMAQHKREKNPSWKRGDYGDE